MQLDDAGQAALASAGRVGVGPRSAHASPAAAARQPHACRSAPSHRLAGPGGAVAQGASRAVALEALLAPCGASGPPHQAHRPPTASPGAGSARERAAPPARPRQGSRGSAPAGRRRGPLPRALPARRGWCARAAPRAGRRGPAGRCRATTDRGAAAPRMPVGRPAARRTAPRGDRPRSAVRRGADQRPELHHGDVPGGGGAGVGGHERLGEGQLRAGERGGSVLAAPVPSGPARGARWCRPRVVRSPKAKAATAAAV